MHYFTRQCHNINIPSMFCLFAVDKRGHTAWQTPRIAFALQKWLNIDPWRPVMENWHPIRDKPMKYSLHVPLSSQKHRWLFFSFLNCSLYRHQFTVTSSSVLATWSMSCMAHTLFIIVVRLWLTHIEPDKVMVWLDIFKSHSKASKINSFRLLKKLNGALIQRIPNSALKVNLVWTCTLKFRKHVKSVYYKYTIVKFFFIY